MSSRTTNSLKNVSAGILVQLIQMGLGFVSRTVFIWYLSAEYLGVSSLFSSILTMLSLTELGISSAFFFELYKPLAEKNEAQIAIIIRYFRKAYHWIGFLVFGVGLILLPFLHQIIAEPPKTIVEDIRIIYLFYLFESASSYFFSYKISLLSVDQKNYVITRYQIQFYIVATLLQILILVLTQNFLFYLSIQIGRQFFSNWYISRVVDKHYPYLRKFDNKKINPETRINIFINAKASFFTKIGGVLVNSTDNIFISAFVGLTLLGKYSNYVMLLGIVGSLLSLVFNNIQASIANFVVTESLERKREMFKILNFMNFLGFGIVSLGFYFCANDFIRIWVGGNYLISNYVVFAMIVNFFMMGMQNAFWIYKSAHGLFRYGQYIVLFTGLINIVLSYWLGTEYGIFGILIATAIARLVTNFWYDPFIVLKLGLKENPLHYALRFAKYVSILLGLGFLFHYLFGFLQLTAWLQIVVMVLTILTISCLLIFILFRKSEEFKGMLNLLQKVLQQIGLIKKTVNG